MRRCWWLVRSSRSVAQPLARAWASPSRELCVVVLPSALPASAVRLAVHSRSFSGNSPGVEGDPDDKPRKREPVDTSTALDRQRELRQVERRIEEHRRAHAAGVNIDVALEDGSREGNATATEGSADAKAPVPTAPGALRLVDPNAPDTAGPKDVVVRSRTTTGQVLWPATQEDIEILSDSKLMYPAPMDVEGSTIIRLVRLSDPVTSPVGRVVRNRQFGIRGNEKWQLLAMGAICTGFVYCLGIWQLKRMEWKRDLIEMRRTRLAAPRLVVNSSPFIWKDQVQDYVYRVVDVRGVFEHHKEMRVGPRPGMDVDSGETQVGYNIVTPLRLEDGSTVLVNRGHVGIDKLDPADRPEYPTWVRVRGVLEEGEIANLVASHARLKNRPDKNQYIYLVAEELAENAGARNHQECAQALITAFDCLNEDDFKAGMRRHSPFSMRHKEDYLLFWADEHTHFNYAMQWFGMGSLLMTMTVYKFIEVSRWRF